MGCKKRPLARDAIAYTSQEERLHGSSPKTRISRLPLLAMGLTHGADPYLRLASSDVHLVAEAFDVVERITYCDSRWRQ